MRLRKIFDHWSSHSGQNFPHQVICKVGFCAERNFPHPNTACGAGSSLLLTGSFLDEELPCWSREQPLAQSLPSSGLSALPSPRDPALGRSCHAPPGRSPLALSPLGHGTIWHLQVLGDHGRWPVLGVLCLSTQGHADEGLCDRPGGSGRNHLWGPTGEVLHPCKCFPPCLMC